MAKNYKDRLYLKIKYENQKYKIWKELSEDWEILMASGICLDGLYNQDDIKMSQIDYGWELEDGCNEEELLHLYCYRDGLVITLAEVKELYYKI